MPKSSRKLYRYRSEGIMLVKIIITALLLIFLLGILEFLIVIYVITRGKDIPERRWMRTIDDIGQMEYLKEYAKKQREKEKEKRVRKIRKRFRRK